MGTELLDHCFREAHGSADLADRHARSEGDDVGDHSGAIRAVLLVDVLEHLLAMVGGEIDVNVGRALVVLVQESLEEQVVRTGIGARDTEQVRRKTPAGRVFSMTSSSRCSRAATARVIGWYLRCTASWQSA